MPAPACGNACAAALPAGWAPLSSSHLPGPRRAGARAAAGPGDVGLPRDLFTGDQPGAHALPLGPAPTPAGNEATRLPCRLLDYYFASVPARVVHAWSGPLSAISIARRPVDRCRGLRSVAGSGRRGTLLMAASPTITRGGRLRNGLAYASSLIPPPDPLALACRVPAKPCAGAAAHYSRTFGLMRWTLSIPLVVVACRTERRYESARMRGLGRGVRGA